MSTTLHVASLGVLLAAASALAVGRPAASARLEQALKQSGTDERMLVWVFFNDKGRYELQKNSVPPDVVSARSLRRRGNVLPTDRLVDATDLPVEERYVEEVAGIVLEVRHRSRWFNAVSVIATPAQIERLSRLASVREIELAVRSRRAPLPPGPEQNAPTPPEGLKKPEAPHLLDYGPSLPQLQQINVPAVHDAGNAAEGVMIGVFDNGFRIPNHESLTSMAVHATRDFVDRKESIVPLNPNHGWHGMYTLSAIGGYSPAKLIGPAFGATYLLARTENDSSETPFEEDNWVAAIEWADSIGVQVTSTSLGYLTYDAPYVSWTWQDMDGSTTVISRAATMAARKGIVVVNSAGNGGYSPSQNTLNAPADADSIIAAGAVDSSGLRASFSSVGPTTSVPARIKPDLMARGVSTRCASSTSTTGYAAVSGTSLSCPLVAGVAALLVKARPQSTPMEVIGALKATANRSSSPDNLYGWGLIDAQAAIAFLLGTDTGSGEGTPTRFALLQNYPNPFNPATTIRVDLPAGGNVSLRVFDPLGREVAVLLDGWMDAGRHSVIFDGTALATGPYFCRLTSGGFTQTRAMLLLK